MACASSRVRRAHPRSRGENSACKSFVLKVSGSSPLTRGKHSLRVLDPTQCRLIPAHAGKTLAGRFYRWNQGAHPRSRGENSDVAARGQDVRGSSPLTRGKRRPGGHEAVRARLIPAHAGKTSRIPTFGRCTPAHPRSRGENFVAAMYALGLRGSSPLTRGKLLRFVIEGPAYRLIPAHAGKT